MSFYRLPVVTNYYCLYVGSEAIENLFGERTAQTGIYCHRLVIFILVRVSRDRKLPFSFSPRFTLIPMVGVGVASTTVKIPSLKTVLT